MPVPVLISNFSQKMRLGEKSSKTRVNLREQRDCCCCKDDPHGYFIASRSRLLAGKTLVTLPMMPKVIQVIGETRGNLIADRLHPMWRIVFFIKTLISNI